VRRKTLDEIRAMRVAGRVVAQTLAVVRAAAVDGVTPRELDALAARSIAEHGASPSFLGYHGYPATLCTSVNEVVVHGIPDDRPLRDGDVLSVDCGAHVGGWHGDAAFTMVIGNGVAGGAGSAEDHALVSAVEAALAAGIAAMRPGGVLRDIGTAVERSVRASGGYGILTDFTGHGIGRQMHEDPSVPNVRVRRKGPRLEPGVVLAIEPMITIGSPDVVVLDDAWTVRTLDGSRAAHAEHTVALLEDGPVVLTAVECPALD
jgi:methionyl aminopeptidase